MSKLLAAIGFAALAACSAMYADQASAAPPPIPHAQIAIASAPEKIRAPYDVEIIRENGDVLPTYAAKDRFYVQGNAGERYILRITNPTPNRVEAVVTVDGLDVIDGEAGDLRKRGYVVPPYGETRIEGFRTSSANVATFRFSAVDDSYAGRQGKARNVGVVAVAIFQEEAQQQIIQQAPQPPPSGPYRYEDDIEGQREAPPRAKKAPAHGADDNGDAVASRQPAPVSTAAPRGYGGGAAGAPAAPHVAPSRPSPTPQPPRDYVDRRSADKDDDGEYDAPKTGRPGLGTEYGEQRYSATSFTTFQRASQAPVAIAELRYNDTAGLTALGIIVQPMPDEGELMTRETADPFPGDRGYARPPR
jgi:hypothetical protein